MKELIKKIIKKMAMKKAVKDLEGAIKETKDIFSFATYEERIVKGINFHLTEIIGRKIKNEHSLKKVIIFGCSQYYDIFFVSKKALEKALEKAAKETAANVYMESLGFCRRERKAPEDVIDSQIFANKYWEANKVEICNTITEVLLSSVSLYYKDKEEIKITFELLNYLIHIQ